jgi:iron complex outermembrane recepter protein
LAQEIELLKGAEALRYASDGVGGVVMIRPPSIFREKAGHLIGELDLLGASNGRIGTVSGFLGHKISNKIPLYWRVQGTLQQGGNIRTPDYFLANTGKKEQNYSLHVGYRSKRFKTEIFHSRFNNTVGIFAGSHVGNLQDLQKAIASEQPLLQSGFTYAIGRPYQFVTHKMLKLKNDYRINTKNSIECILSFQRNHRQEYDLLRSSSAFAGPSFDYYISTYTGDLTWVKNDFHKLSYKTGITGIHQANAYTGRFFIPGFYQKGIAAFFTSSKHIGKIKYEAGARYDIKQLKAYLWHNNELDTRILNFNSFTYLVMASRPLSSRSRLSISHSRAWRPPAPNELYSNGLHQGLASIEIGDSSLRPESSFNQSITYTLLTNTLYIEAEAYYKYIDGFINLVPSLIPQMTIRGAFPVFRYEQENAEIFGMNFIVKKDLGKHLFVRTAANILFGNNLTSRQPLNQMPPISGKTGVGYEHQKYSIQAFAQYAARQYRYVENTDYKAPPEAYCIIGIDASLPFRIKKQTAKLSFSISNLTNKKYREYLNRFRYFADEQGLNMTIRLLIPLDIQFKKTTKS